MSEDSVAARKVRALVDEIGLDNIFKEFGEIFWERFIKDRGHLWYLDLYNDIGKLRYHLDHKRFKSEYIQKI